ncbi:substrate-binding domain-containing protein [Catalinimonas sp. 4WD22]|uniref:PstS family phosphate ABC transporter substrate-binding protein n=1 Tax=Catalinimonas locisalis TaxID=3133978 RepID=UPI00310123B3
MKINFLSYVSLAFVLWGCQGGSIQQELDTPTSGSIDIVVDESLKPLIEAEIDAFQAIYQQAQIHVTYMAEAEATQLFLADSARLLIMGRQLLPEEKLVLDTQKIIPQQVKAAIDGVALILHPKSQDTVFSYQQFIKLLEGGRDSSAQLGQAMPQIVFDHSYSGIIRWMMDSVARLDRVPAHFYALESHEEVIHYVSQTPEAKGLIGLSWVSDKDDSTVNRFLDQIKVAGIANPSDSSGEAYQPYQAYLANKKYPLSREVYAISREARAGLGSGFLAFLCGDRGQRIVLKSGLVPATMPVRIVQFVAE